MILTNFYYQCCCIFIIGLILGSFYNVLIFRTLSKESILFPPSKCPKCQTRLRWYQNIPLLSYIILNGKCGFCKQKIDVMYPIIELCTAILFVISYIKFGFSIKTVLCITTLSLFLILSGMDIKSKTISLKYSYALIIFALLFNYSHFINSILGGLLGALIIILLRKLSGLFNTEVIGEGDILLIAGLGAFIGIKHALPFILIAFIFQLLFSLPSFLKNIFQHKNYTLIFALCWFSLAYLFVILFHNSIICIKILIFLNLFLSLFIVTKLLIRNSANSIIVPFSPAIFISALLFLYLI